MEQHILRLLLGRDVKIQDLKDSLGLKMLKSQSCHTSMISMKLTIHSSNPIKLANFSSHINHVVVLIIQGVTETLRVVIFFSSLSSKSEK